MPGYLDSIPIDAYAANERMGTRTTVALPGGMALTRLPLSRDVLLEYNERQMAQYRANGSVMLFTPPVGHNNPDSVYRRAVPQRAWFSRIRRLLPLDWALTARSATPRYGSRWPELTYRGTYTFAFEMNVTFEPEGGVTFGYGGYISLADLDHSVERAREPDVEPRPQPRRVLPAWVGRTLDSTLFVSNEAEPSAYSTARDAALAERSLRLDDALRTLAEL